MRTIRVTLSAIATLSILLAYTSLTHPYSAESQIEALLPTASNPDTRADETTLMFSYPDPKYPRHVNDHRLRTRDEIEAPNEVYRPEVK